MAESQRMTADEVLAKLMSDEHADFLRESLGLRISRSEVARTSAGLDE